MKKIISIPLDLDSLLEVFDLRQEDKIIMAIRGPKNEKEVTVVSASLDREHVIILIDGLQKLLNNLTNVKPLLESNQ